MGQNSPALEGVPDPVRSYAQGIQRKRNPIQQASDLTIKAMLGQGASLRTIAEALHLSKTTVARVKARICAQPSGAEDLKSGLMSPLIGEMSIEVVKHFLTEGKKLKVIKGSDAMAAVKVVADRQWPAQQAAPAGPRIQFVQINIDAVRLDDRPNPIDVTPSCAPSGINDTQPVD